MPTCRRMVDSLHAGDPVNDAEFDAQFPERIRDVSATYWTSVLVARRAAKLLADDRARRGLDIGAGAGKFCIVGAVVTRGTFVGVERRASLVEAGRTAIERLGVDRASIVHGDIKDMSFDDGFEKIGIDDVTPSKRLAMWVKTTSGTSSSRRARPSTVP